MKTQVLPITPESVALAAKLLQQGELVALPTETVYGIAADARNGASSPKCPNAPKSWRPPFGPAHLRWSCPAAPRSAT